MSKKTKAIISCVSAVALIFILYNIVWFSFIHIRYQPLIEPIGYNDFDECTLIAEDGYRYSVFKPAYLSFTGNLSLKKYEAMNEVSDDVSCSLIIWPLFNSEYEIGVSVTVYKTEDVQGAIVAFQSYGFILDENKQPVEDLSNEEMKILAENAEQIDLLYKKAYDMWGIGG